jgi:hypothetical protein
MDDHFALEGITLCERGRRFLAPLAGPYLEPHWWGDRQALPVLHYLPAERNSAYIQRLDLAIALAFCLPPKSARRGVRVSLINGDARDLRVENFIWLKRTISAETPLAYTPTEEPTYRFPYLTKSGGTITYIPDPLIRHTFG